MRRDRLRRMTACDDGRDRTTAPVCRRTATSYIVKCVAAKNLASPCRSRRGEAIVRRAVGSSPWKDFSVALRERAQVAIKFA